MDQGISDECGIILVGVAPQLNASAMKPLKRASSRLEYGTATRFSAESANIKPVKQRRSNDDSKTQVNMERQPSLKHFCNEDGDDGIRAVDSFG